MKPGTDPGKLASIGELRARAVENPQEVIAECVSVKDLLDHPGWAVLTRAIDWRNENTLTNALLRQPSENSAEYADLLGFLKGLRELAPTAQRIADLGPRLEAEIRNKESAGQAA